MKRLVIGILAHVDAGKTTLSEALLYRAGAVRRLGRVDHRDAFLDTDAQERERGITIFSKPAVFTAGETWFTLLDTPGHVDFSAETERALAVLDCAVLVVSGTDGVQSHTETLWRLLARYHVPTLVFVNKMDLPGASREGVLAGLARLGAGFADVSADVPRPARDEALAACDETLMEAYFDRGALTDAQIAAAVGRRGVFPCWFGSALRLQGVDELLAGLCAWVPEPPRRAEFAARVYKIGQDEQGVRLTWLKITGGVLRAKAELSGTDAAGAPWREKADSLRIYSGTKFTPADQAQAGQVCAVTGLRSAFAGEGLGAEPDAAAPVLTPVLAYSVLPGPAGCDPHKTLAALRALEQEDPQLHVAWDDQLGEVRVQLMGEVQREVLRRRLADRFGLAVDFGPGRILYQETITEAVEGVGHYEPLRHYAEVHLILEPGAPGSGLRFAADCREEVLDKNWQRLVLTHLAEKTHKGVLTGAPITDLKITLAAGRAHLKHTEGGDFREATYRAVRQGLETARAKGAAVLLEPWYAFRLEAPADALGRIMTELERRGAAFAPPQQAGDTAVLEGTAPVAALEGYGTELAACTKGRGRLALAPASPHYRPCRNADAVIAAAGYDSARDTANPAGSVFCSHGAGYTVPWDEVPAHMHLPACLAPKPAEEPPAAPAPARRSSPGGAVYGRSFEDDKELLAIFERTYGPIKRDPLAAFRPAKAAAPAPAPAAPRGPEYLLVDGYNVVHAWPDLAALAAENLDGARRRLMDILCNYRGVRPCELILVFDAYRVKGGAGVVERYHNISVVYTREAETADMYIEKATRRIAEEEKGRRVRVVTSDGLEQLIILGHGALRVSARAFREEVDAAEREIREYLNRARPGLARDPVAD